MRRKVGFNLARSKAHCEVVAGTVRLACGVLIGVPLFFSNSAGATTFTWTGSGGTGNWNQNTAGSTNWQGNVMPFSDSSTKLIFSSSTQTNNPNQNIASPFVLNGLTFGGSSFVLQGAALQFVSNGKLPQIALTSNQAQQILNPVVVNTTATIVGATTGPMNLTMGGPITGNGTLAIAQLDGYWPTVQFTGDNSGFTGVLQISGGIASFPNGSSLPVHANINVGGANSLGLLSGAGIYTSGTWTTGFGSGAGQVQFGFGVQGFTTYSRFLAASGGPLVVNVGGSSTPQQLSWGTPGWWADGPMQLGTVAVTDSMTVENPIALATSGGAVPTRTIETSGPGVINFTGAISGPSHLELVGGDNGVAEFSANNTYTGVTMVHGYSTLLLNNPNALGVGDSLRLHASGQYFQDTGTVEVNDGLTVPLAAIDAPDGGGEMLTLGSIGTGKFRLNGDISLVVSNGTYAGSLTAAGNMELPAGVHNITFGDGESAVFSASSVLFGAGSLHTTGQGTVTFAGSSSTFSGGVTAETGVVITGSSTVTGGVVSSGPVGTGTFHIGKAVITGTGTSLIANPVSIEADFGISNLTLAGPIALGATTRTINTTSGGIYPTTNVNLAGPISGDPGAGFVLTGAGNVTLSGNNTFTGPVTLGSTTTVSSANALGSPAVGTTVTDSLTVQGVTIAEPIMLDGSKGNVFLQGSGSSPTIAAPVTISGSVFFIGINITGSVKDVSPAGVTGSLLVGGFSTSQVQQIEASTVTLQSTLRLIPSTGAPVASEIDNLVSQFGGNIDVTNNGLIVPHGSSSTPLSSIQSFIATGFHGAAWNGAGIISSTASADTRHLTMLGSLLNNNGAGAPIYTSFEGQAVGLNDVLVKYTYFGDADLNGAVNGADYQQIDHGFGAGLTGWSNGDFNYDGVVNGSDFALIDNTYNQLAATGASALAIIAAPSDLIAFPRATAVPEPMTLGLLGFSAIAVLGGRRRTGPK